jgi:NTE family protein
MGSNRRKIALALQGGGSHGAFSWGVLDRLLQEPDIDIIGVTGTSAGAMNAVVLVDGLLRGGAEGARQRLRMFWESIGAMPGFGSLLWPLSGSAAAAVHLEQTPPYLAWDLVARNLSPYQLNPVNQNPLRAPLDALVDFKRLRAQKDVEVMVCATNVRTARRRTFSNADISADAVLASACLPDLFPAVQIDGEAYWDGGYTGNPALIPLFVKLPGCDVVMVRIDPVVRAEIPRTVREIHDRETEIAFNAASWTEMAAVGMLLALLEQGLLDRERFNRFRFHAVLSSELEQIPPSSKFNNYPPFLEHLFDAGRRTGEAWFKKHGAALGKQSTVNPQDLLQANVLSDVHRQAGATGKEARAA